MTKRVSALLLAAGIGAVAVCASESSPDVEHRDALAEVRKAYEGAIDTDDESARELATIRREIAETQKRVGQENHLLLGQMRELQRNDPIARRIHEELLAAEKEVRELRARLQSRLKAMEEYRDLNAKRLELVAEVQELRNRERILMGAFRRESAEELEK